MILRYGQTWGQGFPDIRKNAMLDIRELLDYEVLKVYNATAEDLEKVIVESVEYEEDGTAKNRFHALYDNDGKLTDMAIVQGHGKRVQALLDENQYMTEAAWNDGIMTRYLLHGTSRKYVASIRKNGLRAGGGWKDRAFIFLVPERPGSYDHPLLRHGTDCVVKIDGRYFLTAGGNGWWT